MSRREGNFLKGLLAGILAGATAGILFAPKSGEETRRDIKNKALELSAEVEKLYAKAKASLEMKLSELKKVGEAIDRTKYTALVDEVVKEVKNDKEVTKEAAEKLSLALKSDWKKVEKALKA